jgi:TRAP-type C4-dicarboxylate transport system permease small subunit
MTDVGSGGNRPPASGAAIGRLIDGSARVLALLGGLLVLAVALIVTSSVLLRWVAQTSVPGDFELAQMLTAVAVFGFLPYCQLRNGNIIVDFFTTSAPLRVRAALDAIANLLYLAFALLICEGMIRAALDARASHTTTMVTGFPVWLAMAAAAIAAGILVLAAAVTVVRRWRESGA